MPLPRRQTIATVGIAALLALPAYLMLGPTASATAPAPREKTETITLPWKITSFRQHDASPKGVSSGDTIQAEYTVTGNRPGTADFSCVAVGTHFLCQGIIRLSEGDIYAQVGPVNETQPAAIVGGTRAFMGMTGQFTQQQNPDNTGVWTIEFRD
jgi:hypothetical protein